MSDLQACAWPRMRGPSVAAVIAWIEQHHVMAWLQVSDTQASCRNPTHPCAHALRRAGLGWGSSSQDDARSELDSTCASLEDRLAAAKEEVQVGGGHDGRHGAWQST